MRDRDRWCECLARPVSRGGGCSVLQRGWRRLFWLVRRRRRERWNLRTDGEMQRAGALVLVLVVHDAGVVANGRGGFGTFAVAVAIGDVVEGTGGVDAADGVV